MGSYLFNAQKSLARRKHSWGQFRVLNNNWSDKIKHSWQCIQKLKNECRKTQGRERKTEGTRELSGARGMIISLVLSSHRRVYLPPWPELSLITITALTDQGNKALRFTECNTEVWDWGRKKLTFFHIEITKGTSHHSLHAGNIFLQVHNDAQKNTWNIKQLYIQYFFVVLENPFLGSRWLLDQ